MTTGSCLHRMALGRGVLFCLGIDLEHKRCASTEGNGRIQDSNSGDVVCHPAATQRGSRGTASWASSLEQRGDTKATISGLGTVLRC